MVDLPLHAPQVNSFNTHHPSSIVGSDPWNDATDGTYTEAWVCRTPTFTADSMFAEFDPFDAGNVLGLTVTLNISMENIGVDDREAYCQIAFWTPDFASQEFYLATLLDDALVHNANADGSVFNHEFVTVLDADTFAPAAWADFTAFLAGGGIVAAQRDGISGTTYDTMLRIHRFAIHLNVEATTEPFAPPCRLSPRDDRHGNTPRLFPPGSSRQSGRMSGYY